MATTSVAADPSWPPAAAGDAAGREPQLGARVTSRARAGLRRTFGGVIEDMVLLLFGALLFPLIILLVGTPLAFVVRVLVDLVRR